MDTAVAKNKLSKVYYGWWIVAAGSVLCVFGYGAWYYAFSALFKPISEEFGWSRATTSIAFSFSRLEGGVEGIITGPLIDKLGPRVLVRVGWTLTAIGFVSMAYIRNFPMFLLTYSLLLSLGMNAGLYMPLQASVAKWFDKKRGKALGVLTSGGALGGSILVPVTAWLIISHGWRSAVIILGIVALILGWALSFVLKPHAPEHYGLRPDGEAAKPANTSGGPASASAQAALEDSGTTTASGLSLRQAMKTQAFWVLVVAFTFGHTALSAIVVHQIPFLTDIGISSIVAAAALGTMTLMSVPGRFAGGFLIDRWKWDIKYLYSIASLAQAGGLFIFSRATSMTWVWAFLVVYGLSYGMRIPLEPAMRAEYFGRKSFATISGWLGAFTITGAFAGPYFAGWIFDSTGSYVGAFLICAAVLLAAAVVALFVRPPDKRTFT